MQIWNNDEERWDHPIADVANMMEFCYHIICHSCIERAERNENLGYWREWYNEKKRSRSLLRVKDLDKDDEGLSWTVYWKGSDRATFKINCVKPLKVQGSDLTYDAPVPTGGATDASANSVLFENRDATENSVEFEAIFTKHKAWKEHVYEGLSTEIESKTTFGNDATPAKEEVDISVAASVEHGTSWGGGTDETHSVKWKLSIPGTTVVGLDGSVIPRVKDSAPPEVFVDPKNAGYKKYWAEKVTLTATAKREVSSFTQRVRGRGAYSVGAMEIRSNPNFGNDHWKWNWDSPEYLMECMQGFHGNEPWESACKPKEWEKLERVKKGLPIDYRFVYHNAGRIKCETWQEIT